MPRPFPVEFRRRAVALVRAGKAITTAAAELGVRAASVDKTDTTWSPLGIPDALNRIVH
jgi:transposase-like protein